MVGVDDSSLQADSRPKSIDLICLALFYMHQMNGVNSRNCTITAP